jgi:hypothetical protein
MEVGFGRGSHRIFDYRRSFWCQLQLQLQLDKYLHFDKARHNATLAQLIKRAFCIIDH